MTPAERLAALRAVANGQVSYGAGRYIFPPETTATVLHQLAVESRSVQYNHDSGAVELTEHGRTELDTLAAGETLPPRPIGRDAVPMLGEIQDAANTMIRLFAHSASTISPAGYEVFRERIGRALTDLDQLAGWTAKAGV